MTAEIRIYVEGGGDCKETKASLRMGFGEFLGELRRRARSKRTRWQIVACGPRNRAFDNFKTALRTHPDAFNVLLVDSEDAVAGPPWQHLEARDRWSPPGVSDEHCHLMVQMMEAWFVADVAALERFFGQGFLSGRLPGRRDVELIEKQVLESSLRKASKHSIKGEYHKTRHGPRLLGEIDPDIVRTRARHCQRLFDVLAAKIG